MNHARGYHTCMVMTLPGKKDLIVIVAGGGKNACQFFPLLGLKYECIFIYFLGISNVETFSLVDQTWEDALDFCDKGYCFQFLGAQGVTTSLTAFLFGGNDIANEAGYSNAIFELTCPNEERLSCGKY